MNSSETKPSFLKIYLKTVFLSCFFVVVFVAAYVVMNKQRVLPDPNQLVVYGRDSCGHTTLLRELLDEAKVEYIYANIDKGFIETEMWIKLGWLSGRTVSTQLPVVEYQNNMLERPPVGDLLSQLTTANESFHEIED